jgi:hypothetical protein
MAREKVVRVRVPSVRTLVLITKAEFDLLTKWVPPLMLRGKK